MSASNRTIVAILAVSALAVAFWMLALAPKREEASELAGQVDEQRIALSEARSKIAVAVEAKKAFPSDYRQLVVLGQAVPAGDETASLLVELNRISRRAKVKFNGLKLEGGGETAEASASTEGSPETPAPTAEGAPSAVPASASVPPTEVAASIMPLGASIGPAGLGVMPYNLTFSGGFFQVAKFIGGIDSLVDAGEGQMTVDGRLVTLDGFALNTEPDNPLVLNSTFSVTTFVTPPTQGVTAGATPTAPAPSTATPAAETAEPEATSEPVSEEQ